MGPSWWSLPALGDRPGSLLPPMLIFTYELPVLIPAARHLLQEAFPVPGPNQLPHQTLWGGPWPLSAQSCV